MRGLRSRVSLAVLGIMALGFVAGCGDSTSGPTIENPMTIRITNNTLGKVLFVFFRECGAANWGIDRLDNHPVTGVIEIGASKNFTEEAGCWDLRADHKSGPEDQDPLETQIEQSVIVAVGTTYEWTLKQAEQGGPD